MAAADEGCQKCKWLGSPQSQSNLRPPIFVQELRCACLHTVRFALRRGYYSYWCCVSCYRAISRTDPFLCLRTPGRGHTSQDGHNYSGQYERFPRGQAPAMVRQALGSAEAVGAEAACRMARGPNWFRCGVGRESLSCVRRSKTCCSLITRKPV